MFGLLTLEEIFINPEPSCGCLLTAATRDWGGGGQVFNVQVWGGGQVFNVQAKDGARV